MSRAGANQALLTSLAILKVNLDEKRGYLDNFVPFVGDCLKRDGRSAFSLGDVRELVVRDFGIDIPHGPLKTLLKRMVRQGLLSRQDSLFQPIRTELGRFDVLAQRTGILRRHAALVERLRDFARERFQASYSSEDAENLLVAYVQDWGLSILRTVVLSEDYQAQLPISTNDEYILSSFVAHVFEQDPDGFDYLESLVKGSMLVGVLYFPDIGKVQKRWDGVSFYFDTHVLLDLLGYAAAEATAAARELVQLLYDLGGNLTCFPQTVEETRGVLLGAGDALRSGMLDGVSPGSIAEYYVREGFTSSDIELRVAHVEESLRDIGVRVVEPPGHREATTLDEAALEQSLQDTVGYRNPRARLHDVTCLTAVHRIRGGFTSSSVESCHAMFITSNSSLVRGCRQFYRGAAGAKTAPLAVLDHDIATLAWLKKPLEAPELPARQLVADCLAALEPSDELWSKYLGEVERLRAGGSVSPNDCTILTYSPEARRILMDETLGNVAAVNPQSIQQVLASARAVITEPILDQARISEEQLKGQGRQERDARIEAERVAVRERDNRVAAERETAKMKRAQAELARKKAGTVAHRLALAAVGAPAMAFLLFIAGYTVWWVSTSSTSFVAVVIASVTCAIGQALMFLDYALDMKLRTRELVRRAEVRIRRWLEPRYAAKYCSWLSLS